ncbi:MAG: UDP-N-acetyl-D-mannosamine dehydrogenase, partial [Nocardioidaceae bacterium]|nr:UDP-N-acetyl-D-mannosamine dehydrogenase [Nocardioidaceae bacterium]
SHLLRAARKVNDAKPHHVAAQVATKSARFVSPTIACLGLAYKANVDDLRESPAVDIVAEIADALPELDLRICEPYVDELPGKLSGRANVRLEKVNDAVDAADIVVLLVDHDQFRSLSRSRLAGKVVYDTRGLWR